MLTFWICLFLLTHNFTRYIVFNTKESSPAYNTIPFWPGLHKRGTSWLEYSNLVFVIIPGTVCSLVSCSPVSLSHLYFSSSHILEILQLLGPFNFLRQESLGCTRIIACQVHAWKVQIPRNHTVQANTTAAVRGNTGTAENVDILLDALAFRVDTLCTNSCFQSLRNVNTLTTLLNKLVTTRQTI